MNWLDGPLDPQQVLFGFKVYWLTRCSGLLQLVSGIFAASDLLSRPQKAAIYRWMASQKHVPENPRPPFWKSLFKISFTILAVVVVMSFVFSLCWIVVASGGEWSDKPMAVLSVALRLWPYMFATLAVFGVLLGGIVGATVNGLIATYRDSVSILRFLAPRIAPWFLPKRFDNTVLWISIVLFVAASVAQIVLS